jgi:hypothetical protein
VFVTGFVAIVVAACIVFTLSGAASRGCAARPR